MINRTASRWIAGAAAIATVGATLLSPVAAQADGWNGNGGARDGDRYAQRYDGGRDYRDSGWHRDNGLQTQKNTLRNVAIGAAVLGVIGLANNNSTEAILGAAGAVIAGSAASRDQRIQNRQHNWFYHRF
jgi:hypothetical protein